MCSVCRRAVYVTGNAACAKAGRTGIGGPSCLALQDTSSSPPWHQHAPVLENHAGRRGCARGLCLGGAAAPACGSAFWAAPVGSAASESTAGRRKRQALFLLLLLLLLLCEPLSHQIRFPQAHQEVSVPGLFWWTSTEELKLNEYGSTHFFERRTVSCLLVTLISNPRDV